MQHALRDDTCEQSCVRKISRQKAHTGRFLLIGLYLQEAVREGVYWIYLAQDTV